MATSEDISRINPIVHEIARLLFEHTTQSTLGSDWTNTLLDVRFDEQGGFTYKIRANRTNGEVVSLSSPTDITLQLLELGNVRPAGQDRWYGFKLEVSAAGGCEVKFDYDPACADDPDFFKS